MASNRTALENEDPPLNLELPQLPSRPDWHMWLPLHIGEDQYKPSERAGIGVRETWVLILVALAHPRQGLRSVNLGVLPSSKNIFRGLLCGLCEILHTKC